MDGGTLSVLPIRVYPDETGASFVIPGILSEQGFIERWTDFCIEDRSRHGLDWQFKLAREILLFGEYVRAQGPGQSPRALFSGFAQRLLQGTFDMQTGLDPSNLCWHPRSYARSNRAITRLTIFFKWVQRKNEAFVHPNPTYAGTPQDIRLDALAHAHKKAEAFLGHTWKSNRSDNHRREVPTFRAPNGNADDAKAFPSEYVEDLIIDGFGKHPRTAPRNALVTLLMHGGGLRVSEPFHLFPTDVIPDPQDETSALVRVRHPAAGLAPQHAGVGPNRMNRREYLERCWGLQPRNELAGKKRAGWKEGKHEKTADGDLFLRVFWAPPEMGRFFLHYWRIYLDQILNLERTHPYALVSFSPDCLGTQHTIARFCEAHDEAVRSIGLVPAKHLGTSVHGHRHAYGKRLSSAGVSEKVIQEAMHHSHPESQKVYTAPTHLEVQSAIADSLGRVSAFPALRSICMPR